ncbi:MAG TPA: hypothetical protein VG096_08915 [Bryobacteraceae bacterium]|jgi:hypothetical protein|nr:hypothetical protein [Bryobacteraceae bacterium]
MRDSIIDLAWQEPETSTQYRTGVCLHGHTMHSEECLSFLPRYLHHVPGVSQIVSRYERGPRPVDFARAFWTPPLSPASALNLEREQIAGLGLRALVSLTDHDNIEAGMSLQVAVDPHEVPVSVEWTVPYARSIFHLGIHNLPPQSAREWMVVMAAYIAAPDETRLPGILSELAKNPEVLIVLNHPFWLEEGIEEEDHRPALDRLLRECVDWLHAFELNGTRCWSENADVLPLAKAHDKPLISGGDRHVSEPSACLNLTNAQSFAEFVSEIREGQSSLLFMPHYREPMALRLLEASWDILRCYPEYPGRERWTDRIFYRSLDGQVRPLSMVWKDRVPWMVRAATGMLQFCATSPLRLALRLLAAEQGEI